MSETADATNDGGLPKLLKWALIVVGVFLAFLFLVVLVAVLGTFFFGFGGSSSGGQFAAALLAAPVAR